MTYSELSQIKTAGFNTNHIIDDVVNNARWAFGKKAFGNKLVTPHEALMIAEWAKREGVNPPVEVPVIAYACRKCGTNGDHYCPADVATE
jgi:hypothetical protein